MKCSRSLGRCPQVNELNQDVTAASRKPTEFAHADLVLKYADEGLNPTDITKKVGIGRASVYRILGAEQAHDIEMRDRLSRWGSRKTT
jgi:hypothetical protein